MSAMASRVDMASSADPAASPGAGCSARTSMSVAVTGRRDRERATSMARLRQIDDAQPRKPSTSPEKRGRSRAICSQVSAVTSSASLPTSAVA